MKIYGYPDRVLPTEYVVPDSLAEITLVASPSELRRIAKFLVNGATTMERIGSAYSHEHLSDSDHSFESSPHFVIAPPAFETNAPSLTSTEQEALSAIVNDYDSPSTSIANIQVGDRVRVKNIPEWLLRDLPLEDQERLKAQKEAVVDVLELMPHGYLWLPFANGYEGEGFSLQPSDVKLEKGSCE